MSKSTNNRVKKALKIYLDYASSSLPNASNPGAIHEFGVQEKNKLEQARTTVAGILNAHPPEIVFTSGATESNNLAILGIVNGLKTKNFLPHLVTTNIEHSSVLQVCKHLEETKQAEVTYVGVEGNGIVDVKKIKKALRPNTVLVSVMYANNEIGTIQPIREIAKEIRHWNKNLTPTLSWRGEGAERRVRLHTDAVQAVNYLLTSVPQLGVDMMSINGAKIYGPKGVGVLYVKKNTPLRPIMFGGDQEFGLRPGTENVALALEFSKALQVAEKIKNQEVKRLTKLRDYFFEKLKTQNQILLNGDLKNRLPNNVNITVPNIPSDLLVIELSARGIMASSKSACKAGDGKASYVIQAIRSKIKDMDLSRRSNAEVDGSIRFSLGRETKKSDIDFTIKALFSILTKLKKWYS